MRSLACVVDAAIGLDHRKAEQARVGLGEDRYVVGDRAIGVAGIRTVSLVHQPVDRVPTG